MGSKYTFHNADGIKSLTEKYSIDLAELALENAAEDYAKDRKELLNDMKLRVNVTKESIEFGLTNTNRTKSGLAGGDAKKLSNTGYENSIVGNSLHDSLVYALAVTEANALHGKVVAFPTAGASGVVPATLLGFAKNKDIDDELIVKSYFVAGAIGIVIAENAMLSGAAGGCQAEIGSATAMAAAGLAYLCGLSTNQILDAAAISLKSMLGLVCDPIAGLVECPCIKRNAIGVANAYASVEMVKAGIESNVPFDQVVASMKEIGLNMNPKYRETAEGGIAKTKVGMAVWRRLFGRV